MYRPLLIIDPDKPLTHLIKLLAPCYDFIPEDYFVLTRKIDRIDAGVPKSGNWDLKLIFL